MAGSGPAGPPAAAGRLPRAGRHRGRRRRLAARVRAGGELPARSSRPPCTSQNWVLAADSVDYLAAAGPPSPAQHYWSLSIEEQFYLVWPLLILPAAVWARRRSSSPTVATGGRASACRRRLAGLLGRVTPPNPPSAYFVTRPGPGSSGSARCWPSALAGRRPGPPATPGRDALRPPALLALGRLRHPRVVRPHGRQDSLPRAAGPPARGGRRGHHRRVRRPRGRLSRLRAALAPEASLGDISYSVYLWHWPPIVVVPVGPRAPHGVRPSPAHPGRRDRGRGGGTKRWGGGPRALHPAPGAAPPPHRPGGGTPWVRPCSSPVPGSAGGTGGGRGAHRAGRRGGRAPGRPRLLRRRRHGPRAPLLQPRPRRHDGPRSRGGRPGDFPRYHGCFPGVTGSGPSSAATSATCPTTCIPHVIVVGGLPRAGAASPPWRPLARAGEDLGDRPDQGQLLVDARPDQPRRQGPRRLVPGVEGQARAVAHRPGARPPT